MSTKLNDVVLFIPPLVGTSTIALTISVTVDVKGYALTTATITLKAQFGPSGGAFATTTNVDNSIELRCISWSGSPIKYDFGFVTANGFVTFQTTQSQVVTVRNIIRSTTQDTVETWGCRATDIKGASSGVVSGAVRIPPAGSVTSAAIVGSVPDLSVNATADQAAAFLGVVARALDAVNIIGSASAGEKSQQIATLSAKLLAAATALGDSSTRSTYAPLVLNGVLTIINLGGDSKIALAAAAKLVAPPMSRESAKLITSVVTAAFGSQASQRRRTDDLISLALQIASRGAHAIVASSSFPPFELLSLDNKANIVVSAVKGTLLPTYKFQNVVFGRPTPYVNDVQVAVYGRVTGDSRIGKSSDLYLYSVGNLYNFLELPSSTFSVDMTELKIGGSVNFWNKASDQWTSCGTGAAVTCTSGFPGTKEAPPMEFAIIRSATAAPTPTDVPPVVVPTSTNVATSRPTTPSTDSDNQRTAAIAGSVIGGVVGICIVVLIIVLIKRRVDAHNLAKSYKANDKIAQNEGQV